MSQPDALLDEWARRDAWSRRATVQQYSLLLPVESIAPKVASIFGPARLAFTQWFAAKLRHPYTDAPMISAYVEALPGAEVLESLNAREVTDGGRLWLLLSKDDGVFQFTQTVDGLTLVSGRPDLSRPASGWTARPRRGAGTAPLGAISPMKHPRHHDYDPDITALSERVLRLHGPRSRTITTNWCWSAASCPATSVVRGPQCCQR